MRVRATKTTTFHISVSKQDHRDEFDGADPGFYAWVGPLDDQHDFCVGPYKTAKEARVAACERLRRMGYTVERKR